MQINSLEDVLKKAYSAERVTKAIYGGSYFEFRVYAVTLPHQFQPTELNSYYQCHQCSKCGLLARLNKDGTYYGLIDLPLDQGNEPSCDDRIMMDILL